MWERHLAAISVPNYRIIRGRMPHPQSADILLKNDAKLMTI